MFPDRSVRIELYAAPAQALTEAAEKDAATCQLLVTGWETLNRACGGSWKQASANLRTRAIASIVGSPLFLLVRKTTVFSFYNNPAVWATCGYEGEAWSHGGYAGPGLVTIDWLPPRRRDQRTASI
jgi:hypothetical protein